MAYRPQLPDKYSLGSVRFVCGVAAGKGGVGKSSTSVALALALQKQGYAVGLLDADLYGPSLGVMLPLSESLESIESKIVPAEIWGIKVFSFGYLRPNEPLVARAPIANGLILQAIRDVAWGELDYLIVDFPPGTGDIQITLLQEVVFSGAVLVTTPQSVSVEDVCKSGRMFQEMGVPLLGVIENMSYFVETNGEKRAIFGEGGGEMIARILGCALLGKVPIDPAICACLDKGENLFAESVDSLAVKAYSDITTEIKNELFVIEEQREKAVKNFEMSWKS